MRNLLILAAIALILLAGCAQSQPGASGGTGGSSSSSSGGTNNTPGPQSGTADVSMSGFAFSPASVTIAKGATVRWTNLDPAPHTVTADDTSQFASGTLAQNEKFEHKFDTPGTYTYHCSIHTDMKGTVIVQ